MAGERYPQNFNVDTTFKDSNGKVDNIVDPQAYRDFLNAVKTFTRLDRSIASPITTHPFIIDNDDDGLMGGLVFGLGQSYTSTGDDGADFSRANWGLQMDCELTDDSPNSVFVFVHSKMTLLFNDSGIQVLK